MWIRFESTGGDELAVPDTYSTFKSKLYHFNSIYSIIMSVPEESSKGRI